jgi:A/G-specific adenine glycosylase
MRTTRAKMKTGGRDVSPGAINSFRTVILEYYKKYGRSLPWRLTTDPYRVLVSEIMLQQTQVDRVTPKYEEFVVRFPDFSALARATLQDVLQVWQGLGYNRRAIFLKRIAEQIMQEPAREFPQDIDRLQKLPGLGYATACSLMAFAFNAPVVFIETNIRTVFTHFFFPDKENIKDSEILPLVAQTLDRQNPRVWYWALMDYGSMLKRTQGSNNPRSAHYQKQTPFKGSDRQVRGMILRHLLAHPRSTASSMTRELEIPLGRLEQSLQRLAAEGFVRENEGAYTIA